MGNRLNREKIAQNVYFSSVTDSRYKTNRISVNLMLPLRKETATANALLSSMLRKSGAEYENFMTISKKLSDLYGAYLDSDVLKIGENQGLSLYITAIDDRYALNHEPLTTECARLLCSLLLKPNIKNGAFNEKELEVEKQVLIDEIESEINEKRSYAVMQCSKSMCEGERFAIPRYGYKDDVPSITAESLVKTYQDAVSSALVEVFFTGCGSPDAAKKIFVDAFQEISRGEDYRLSTEVIREVKQVKEVTEQLDVAQSKLVLGFRAGSDISDNDKNLAALLMVAIYGSTPSSKLFLNVREKLSLCYYCAARYDRYKGILMVDCGIEAGNMRKAKNEILKQLEEMQNGNITADELHHALLAIKNGYRAVFDSTKSVETYYLGQIFSGTTYDPEEVLAQLEGITFEAVQNAAQRIKLDTVYFLTGEKQ